MPNDNSENDSKPDVELEETLETTSEIDTSLKTEPIVITKPATSVAPVVPESSTPSIDGSQNSAGVLVLQWLTYAFWGWLILALIWLMTVVLANAILDEDVSGMVPYAMAAGIVLLPLAFITDHFYRKHEPLKKVGGAAIIMVLHTVLFAILGIVCLIIAVFTGVNLAINSGDVDARLVSLSIAAFAAVLYGAAFLRTLNPFKSRKPLSIYSFAMLGLTVLLLIFAIAGPLAKSVATRNDRLIEQNLSTVQRAVNEHIEEKNALPESLKDIELDSPEAQRLVDEDLVTYKKEASVSKSTIRSDEKSVEYRYQLCVEYSSANDRYKSQYYRQDEYSEFLSISYHDAGEQCYKLKSIDFAFDNNNDNIDFEIDNLRN